MSMKETSYCIHKYSHHLIPLYVIFIRGWQPESHYISIHAGYAMNNHDNMTFKYYIDLRYNS